MVRPGVEWLSPTTPDITLGRSTSSLLHLHVSVQEAPAAVLQARAAARNVACQLAADAFRENHLTWEQLLTPDKPTLTTTSQLMQHYPVPRLSLQR